MNDPLDDSVIITELDATPSAITGKMGKTQNIKNFLDADDGNIDETNNLDIKDFDADFDLPSIGKKHIKKPKKKISGVKNTGVNIVGSQEPNISDLQSLLSRDPKNKDIVRQKINIAKQDISLFPSNGTDDINAVDFLKRANANYIADLNEFNTVY